MADRGDLVWRSTLQAASGSKAIVCALALVAFIVWVGTRRRNRLEITVESGRVTALHGVAKAQTKRVVDFLERDVALNGKVKVVGGRDRNGVLRISFRGNIDEGTGQQIRNYLKMIL